ncbi:hypothetical protein, partial [Paraburkholderia caledonica]|uniref:hypothetical protein n=1 Tax=Paraburkholderia caledonica TaxID=134536 RepID=UPI003CB84BB1
LREPRLSELCRLSQMIDAQKATRFIFDRHIAVTDFRSENSRRGIHVFVTLLLIGLAIRSRSHRRFARRQSASKECGREGKSRGGAAGTRRARQV